MAEEVQINPFTGKPFGAEPSIDTTTDGSPTEINPYTGKPVQENDGPLLLM